MYVLEAARDKIPRLQKKQCGNTSKISNSKAYTTVKRSLKRGKKGSRVNSLNLSAIILVMVLRLASTVSKKIKTKVPELSDFSGFGNSWSQ